MGRAEKYADVVNKYKEEPEKEIETEEKLSMTRELKFETIQKKLDKRVTVGDAEEIVKLEDGESFEKDVTSEIEIEENALNNTDTLEVETLEEEELEVKPVPKKEKKMDEELVSSKEMKKAKNEIEDDMYLTTSLKPFRKRLKLKKVFKVLFSWILIAFLCFVLYLIAYKPIYNFIVNSNPKKVFENSVNYVVTNLKKELEEIKYDNGTIYTDLNFRISSNMESYENYNNYSFGYGIGAKPTDKKYQRSIYLQGNGSTYADELMEIDGKEYEHFSPNGSYISLSKSSGKESQFITSEPLKVLANLFDQDNLNYVLDKEMNIAKDLFEDRMFSKVSDEMEINGTTIKTTRNTLKLNAADYKAVSKKYAEETLKDDKLIEALAKLTGKSQIDVTKYFNNLIEKDVDEGYELTFNIYTTITNKVMGFDISENGFRIAYMYFKDNNFSVHLNVSKDEKCLKGKDCIVTNQRIFDFNGVDKGDYTEVKVLYNGNDFAKLNVRSFNEKIDFDYELYRKSNTYTGSLLLNKKDKIDSSFELSIKLGSDYVNLNGEINLKNPNNFANVNDEEIIDGSRREREIQEYKNLIDNDDVEEALFRWIDIIDKPSLIFEK